MSKVPASEVSESGFSASNTNSGELTQDQLYRFGGIARLYGVHGLAAFARSHVAVIGIGGVGSWAAEALARSGVGKITLFDLDDICVSNINRQLHALDSTVGKMKVEVMASRLKDINPSIQVTAEHAFITPKNIQSYLDRQFDAVFDATDSVSAKTAIIAHCSRHKIRLVCSGGAGGQIDPTQIQIADLNRTVQDPLLAKVRNNLRRLHGFSRNPKRKYGIDCVFSTEQARFPQPDGSVCQQRSAEGGPVRLDCASGFGAVTHMTATFAFMAVSRILRKLAISTE